MNFFIHYIHHYIHHHFSPLLTTTIFTTIKSRCVPSLLRISQIHRYHRVGIDRSYASSSCSWGKSCAKRSNSRSMAPRFEVAREWNDGAWLGMFDGSETKPWKFGDVWWCVYLYYFHLFPIVGKAINQLSTNYSMMRCHSPIESYWPIGYSSRTSSKHRCSVTGEARPWSKPGKISVNSVVWQPWGNHDKSWTLCLIIMINYWPSDIFKCELSTVDFWKASTLNLERCIARKFKKKHDSGVVSSCLHYCNMVHFRFLTVLRIPPNVQCWSYHHGLPYSRGITVSI